MLQTVAALTMLVLGIALLLCAFGLVVLLCLVRYNKAKERWPMEQRIATEQNKGQEQ